MSDQITVHTTKVSEPDDILTSLKYIVSNRANGLLDLIDSFEKPVKEPNGWVIKNEHCSITKVDKMYHIDIFNGLENKLTSNTLYEAFVFIYNYIDQRKNNVSTK